MCFSSYFSKIDEVQGWEMRVLFFINESFFPFAEKTREDSKKSWKSLEILKKISKFWNSWNFYVIFEKHVVI